MVTGSAAASLCQQALSDAQIAAIEQDFLDSWNEKYPSARPEPTPTLIPNGGYSADIKTGLRTPIGIERVEPPGCPELNGQ
ncbi:hypothetical protein GCM10010412_000770 [Nonomuraea recticatena]|uniref:Uncharacterized protein n=1 Tax=Nonomuraea recticatena TaxID=46178 RepID=A0ABN3R4F4_9ACTN